MVHKNTTIDVVGFKRWRNGDRVPQPPPRWSICFPGTRGIEPYYRNRSALQVLSCGSHTSIFREAIVSSMDAQQWM